MLFRSFAAMLSVSDNIIPRKFVHPENAEFPIAFIVGGSCTFSSLVAFANPFVATDVTVQTFPSISAFRGILTVVTVLSNSFTLQVVSLVFTKASPDDSCAHASVCTPKTVAQHAQSSKTNNNRTKVLFFLLVHIILPPLCVNTYINVYRKNSVFVPIFLIFFVIYNYFLFSVICF